MAVRGWNSALLVAVGTESASCSRWGCTLRFLRHLALQLWTSCGSCCCNCALNAAVGAATVRLMRQLALQLCAECDSWGCNCALHVAVCSALHVAVRGWNSALLAEVGTELCASCSSWHGAATLLFMRKLALQLCATCDSWGCNSCQSYIPRCTTSAVKAQLCATCGSWGCNSALLASLCVATLCFLRHFVLLLCASCSSGGSTLRYIPQLGLQLCVSRDSCQLSTVAGAVLTFFVATTERNKLQFGLPEEARKEYLRKPGRMWAMRISFMFCSSMMVSCLLPRFLFNLLESVLYSRSSFPKIRLLFVFLFKTL